MSLLLSTRSSPRGEGGSFVPCGSTPGPATKIIIMSMDLWLIIRWQSCTFCLRQQEWREIQFNYEVRSAKGAFSAWCKVWQQEIVQTRECQLVRQCRSPIYWHDSRGGKAYSCLPDGNFDNRPSFCLANLQLLMYM